MKRKLQNRFCELFGADGDIRFYFSPGRVNLIGEHTDYNGGHVFPCALTNGTYGAARIRKDRKLRLYSENFSNAGIFETSLDDLAYHDRAGWTNYLKGVIWTYCTKGYPVEKGLDLVIGGNIPNGSGLSSSASIELLMAMVLKDLYGFSDLTKTDMALFGQYAENKFCGMNCGIMDQFTVAMGKKGHAIFLDTSNLNYEYVPVKLGNASLIISVSNKKRRLTDSKYNERRRECEAALKELQSAVNIRSLGELTGEAFEEVREIIKDPVHLKRARHAVYENQRTIQAEKALKERDLKLFGRLMNESHISLRDDYEVTGRELDTLAEAAWNQPGVLGSRMTGAGFGGCTVSIVENGFVDAFIRNVGSFYKKKIGYSADFYKVEIGAGAGRIG